jgi:hypothetical protein
VIDVWSRLWPSTVVGKRSYQNTLVLFQDLSRRMSLEIIHLITADGFFYERVVNQHFSSALRDNVDRSNLPQRGHWTLPRAYPIRIRPGGSLD